jgi:hypothetical protein
MIFIGQLFPVARAVQAKDEQDQLLSDKQQGAAACAVRWRARRTGSLRLTARACINHPAFLMVIRATKKSYGALESCCRRRPPRLSDQYIAA